MSTVGYLQHEALETQDRYFISRSILASTAGIALIELLSLRGAK